MCGHSFEGHEVGVELDHGIKAMINLVVEGGDAAEQHEGAEKVPDR